MDKNIPGMFRKRQQQYRHDPILFFKEVLSFHPDPWQEAVARDVAEHSRVTVRSGQGVGKTGLEAALLLWFLTCFPYARVVATAPTRQQLHDVLWSEVAKWQANSPLLSAILKWTKTYIHMMGMEKRWFAVARTATRPENMQGFHEENMLFIVDEASGVADPILEAILGTLTGSNNRLLMCGNPTKASGVFHASHTKNRGKYRAHRVSSRDSGRTSKANIAALEDDYGKESNVVRVRVDGEFPIAEDDVFIPLHLLEAAVMTEPKLVSKGKSEELKVQSIHIACDVARYGDDKTTIGSRLNEVVRLHKKIRGQNTMRTASDIVLLGESLIKQYDYRQPIPIKVDDGGVGGGVVDRLQQIKRSDPERYWWMEIFPVAFGRPIKHRHYHDSTTYMMSVVKKLLTPPEDNGPEWKPELVLPNDNDLIAQLSVRKYRINERNKIVVESKKEMKKRGLPSPDEADCVLLLCLPVQVRKERRKVP